jgi:hypothetical protein
MASPQVYDQIKAFLTAVAAPMPVLDFDSIQPALEQQNNTFLVLEEVFGEDNLVTFGDPQRVCMREEASLIVHCFVPAPESSGVARTTADSLRRALDHQIFGGVRILSVSTPDLVDMNDGLWTAALLDIEARYDRFTALP